MNIQIENGNILSFLLSRGVVEYTYKGIKSRVDTGKIHLLKSQNMIFTMRIGCMYAELLMEGCIILISIPDIKIFDEFAVNENTVRYGLLISRIKDYISIRPLDFELSLTPYNHSVLDQVFLPLNE